MNFRYFSVIEIDSCTRVQKHCHKNSSQTSVHSPLVKNPCLCVGYGTRFLDRRGICNRCEGAIVIGIVVQRNRQLCSSTLQSNMDFTE